jgi:hypothetical protein
MRFEKYKMFYKNPASNTAISAKYPELHILHALYVISPFRG